MVFCVMFCSITSPYFIYYSSYMRLVLFKDSYAPNKFAKLNCWGKIFLGANLTCIGGLSFILFDLSAKLTAGLLAIAFLTTPIFGMRVVKWVFDFYETFLIEVFKLDH